MDIKNRKAPHRFQRGDEVALLIDIKRDDYVIPGLLVARIGEATDIDGRLQPAGTLVRLGCGPIAEVYAILAQAGWLPIDSEAPHGLTVPAWLPLPIAPLAA